MLEFNKMNSLGNDFVVFNGVSQDVRLTESDAKAIADRQNGIGCDQILIVSSHHSEKSGSGDNKANFDFQIFNHDGSQSSQCGNGARCVARYLYDIGLALGKSIWLTTNSTILLCTINDDLSVTASLGVPEFRPERIPFIANEQKFRYELDVEGEIVEIFALAIGNPHAVIVVDDVEQAPVGKLGALIESYPGFPERTNVEFMQVLSSSSIKLRVYERGVGETTACGSGSCAAVVAGQRMGLLGNGSVNVSLPGGVLQVEWDQQSTDGQVYLTGPTEYEFKGVWER